MQSEPVTSVPHLDSNSPVVACCHELAHALAAWEAGRSISKFCVRGDKSVDPGPRFDDPEDDFVIAAAGRLAEQIVMKIADPSGCRRDMELCEAFSDHAEAGTERATRLVTDNSEALRCAAEQIAKRLNLPRSNGARLADCPDPSLVAEIMSGCLQKHGLEVPPSLGAQLPVSDESADAN